MKKISIKNLYLLIIIGLGACTKVNQTTDIYKTSIPSNSNTFIVNTDIPNKTVEISTSLLSASNEPTSIIFFHDDVYNQQFAEINEVITKYFNMHYKELSIAPINDFENSGFATLVSDSTEAQEFLLLETKKILAEKKYYEINELRYVEYDYSLDYLEVEFDDNNTAFITLNERFDIICERAVESNANNPRSCAVGEFTHELTLQKENDQWKIISDIYWDSWWRKFRSSENSTKDILQKINSLQNQLQQTEIP